MKAFIKKYKYVLSAVLFAALIYITAKVIFKQQTLPEMIHTMKSVNPVFLLVAVSMMVIYAFCETMNMHLLLGALGQKVPFYRCLGYVNVGYYFSSITPTSMGGQPMQLVYMNRDRIPVSVSSLAILLYLVIYQTTLLLFCLSMYIIRFSFLHITLLSIKFFLLYGICASLFLIVSVVSVSLSKSNVERVVNFVISFLSKIKIIKDKEKATGNAQKQMTEYEQGIQYLKSHGKLVIKMCAFTFMQYLAFFSIPYFVYRSFGFHQYGYLDLVSAQSMIHLSSQSVPLPGAVGAAENAFYQIFSHIYPAKVLMPAMVLSRGISFYGFMILSGIITLLFHFRGLFIINCQSIQNAKDTDKIQ